MCDGEHRNDITSHQASVWSWPGSNRRPHAACKSKSHLEDQERVQIMTDSMQSICATTAPQPHRNAVDINPIIMERL